MNRLTTDKRAMILHSLVEGNSINATSRMCGCSKITVLRLLADAGTFCANYHGSSIVSGLDSVDIQEPLSH